MTYPYPPPVIAALGAIAAAQDALDAAEEAAAETVADIGRDIVPGVWRGRSATPTDAAATMRRSGVVVILTVCGRGWRTYLSGDLDTSAIIAGPHRSDARLAMQDAADALDRRAGPAPWSNTASREREVAAYIRAALEAP